MKGKSVTVAGWGSTICPDGKNCDDAAEPDVLQEITLNTLRAADCKTAAAQDGFGDTTANKQFCYGGVAGQSTCFGDSGSPITYFDGSK